MRSKAYIDKRSVYLTGYSMGGEGALDLLARKLELFAAAVALCPVADTANATILKQKPIWIFHGDKDVVNEVKYSRIMVARLKAVGSPVKYTEYADEGHQVGNRAYNDPELFKWLFKQKLK
jgi:predicted peptidase